MGARVPGYARPIRDDVKDHAPHGTIDLRRAIVVSCNAYFAQLAVQLGARALLERLMAQASENPANVGELREVLRESEVEELDPQLPPGDFDPDTELAKLT